MKLFQHNLEYSILHTGSCVAADYTSCCVLSDTEQCFGYPETCKCDQLCFEYGDCCSDVIDVGCIAPNGSCIASGHTTCCNSSDSDCMGTPGNCYCDRGCFDRGDCCRDIENLTNCHQNITGKKSNQQYAVKPLNVGTSKIRTPLKN